MHRAARIIGLVWMALTMFGAIAVLIRFNSLPVIPQRGYGLIAIAFFVFVPGALLYRWGRGPYRAYPSTRENLNRAYPSATADEMGHVVRVGKDGV